MSNLDNTIEDLLEILAGLQGQAKIQILPTDASIMYSIARQTFKGVALTDRQFLLMQEKLQTYQDQFTALEYNFDSAVQTLRQPLREINREKSITIVTADNKDNLNKISRGQWIKVRFPFSKRTIVLIEQLHKERSEYYHESGSHEHYFKMSEQNVYNILNLFQNKEFKIDKELLTLYQQLEEMANNKENFIPGIYNFKLKNLNDRAISHMISTIGNPSKDTLALYKDREKYYGIHHFDQNDLNDSIFDLTILSQKIVNRKHKTVLVNKNKYTFGNISEALLELNRFPLLVILSEESPLEDLIEVHTAFKGFIGNDEHAVLFRLDNTQNSEFNSYIKSNNLNSPLDNNPKIVYISNNKIPKPLIKSTWAGSAMLSMSSFRYNSKTKVLADEMDLVVHYDTDVSQFMRAGIEEL